MIHRLFPFVAADQPGWTGLKVWLSTALGLSDDTMHIMTGLIVLTLAALALRRAPWSGWPWAALLVAETLNEIYDLTHGSDEGNLADSWHDFWITLLWPTIVLLVWRRWGVRAGAAGRSRDQVHQPFE
ncbi:hypothetical protein [Sphingomonas bacterium]|uniref:hypothetical protein n=1 Tax=Sphingomonas bacterium TaxID=1895847 RepID=UPI00157685C6|nr:hypothetical protein [Sphingomonas bacterium]